MNEEYIEHLEEIIKDLKDKLELQKSLNRAMQLTEKLRE